MPPVSALIVTGKGSLLLLNYRQSPLVETTLHCFTSERPTLVPVFTNGKKLEEDFHFYKKRQKAKTPFSFCFAASSYRSSEHSEQPEWHHQAPSPGATLKSQPQAIIALNCVCEHLCYLDLFCAPVSMMCPKVTASSMYAISA